MPLSSSLSSNLSSYYKESNELVKLHITIQKTHDIKQTKSSTNTKNSIENVRHLHIHASITHCFTASPQGVTNEYKGPATSN